MNLPQFVKDYPNEETCLEKFVAYRLERGITCAKCNAQTNGESDIIYRKHKNCK